MAGTPLILRVRSKKGVARLQSLTANSSLKDLKHQITDTTGIEYSNIKIMKGYPPTALDTSNENATLQTLYLKDGELLTIEECSSSGEKQQSNESKTALSEKSNTKSSTSVSLPKEAKKTDGVFRKVVPANNSCLFTSVHFVMENGVLNLDCQKAMRDMIAKSVSSDPITFNEAILGKKNSDYCKWIKDSTSWGGSIEIMILSKYYKCEICVVDIRTGRIDRFGEDCAYPQRVFIIYDGIHFDPLYLQTNIHEPDNIQTKFSTKNDAIMVQALELADEAKKAKQFTDVANFKLRCLCCQQPLGGQVEAQKHAEKTGHINFGEINA